MLDYHLHLWEHGRRSLQCFVEQVADYCERAVAAGVREIAITEHFNRFRQADAALSGWWETDGDDGLQAAMKAYWDEELGADLDDYVEMVEAAKATGLPVVLGLEVDHYAGRMHEVASVLEGYPFDVLLGSVHWLGAWAFDHLSDPRFAAEWARRSIESVWDDYTSALEELADSGVCDVLAHPDLCKLTGARPAVPDEWYDRMAEAAARAGMAAELSTAGLRKPLGEAYPAPALLARFRARGVAITTASDAHKLSRVAERRDELAELLMAAGYDRLNRYRHRRALPTAIGPTLQVD